MAWIRVVDEEEAAGELRETYDQVREKRGSVANVYKAHSLRPETMLAHMEFYLKLLYGRSRLSRMEREMIAVAVSRANRCAYCVRHHGDALSKYLKEAAVLEQLATDYRQAALSARHRAMLDYAVMLTTALPEVTQETLAPLRAAGVGDDEILDVNLIASYFNFVNRFVAGLGVELEPGVSAATYKY